ncbi:MAG: PQQ-binding-like beta-propeller repeat protein [Acidimicrobiales bacterium]
MAIDLRRPRRITVAASAVAVLAASLVWWAVAQPSDDVCDGEVGPAALVAVDAATGNEAWTSLVGSAVIGDTTVEDNRLHVRTPDHELVVAMDSGELVSCVDVGQEIIAPQATSGPIPPAAPAPEVHVADGVRLEVLPASEGSVNRQQIRLTTIDDESGDERWTGVVPGFEARLAAGVVAVIDQTGGTGNFNWADQETRLTAYSPDGDQLWHVALPGSPNDAIGVGDLVVAPGETSIVAVDAATGGVVWDVDHGSPGANGRYDIAGEYARLFATDDGTVVVGVIEAREPYRD